jgi:tetratricopeptide (TPR) repeat protein
MHPPALRARLLGPVDLQLDDRPLPPLDSARAESLLAFLLLHRDSPQPRQHLAFLLWPGSTEGQAQTNLRKVLHTLRRALPDADRLIEIGARTLRWRADVPLWLDVEQFERAAAGDRLEEAVEVYGGELLEGRYDEWLAGDRERLAGLYADALERLARRYEQQQRWPEAIRCAERLVARDPLREESHPGARARRAPGRGHHRAALRTGGRDRGGRPLVRTGGGGRAVAARPRRRGTRAGARAGAVRGPADGPGHRPAPVAAANRAARAATGLRGLRI